MSFLTNPQSLPLPYLPAVFIHETLTPGSGGNFTMPDAGYVGMVTAMDCAALGDLIGGYLSLETSSGTRIWVESFDTTISIYESWRGLYFLDPGETITVENFATIECGVTVSGWLIGGPRFPT